MVHHVQNCHWSVPTLLMPRPFWYAANESAWCCWNDRGITTLASTAACEACPLWKPREAADADGCTIPPRGAAQLS